MLPFTFYSHSKAAWIDGTNQSGFPFWFIYTEIEMLCTECKNVIPSVPKSHQPINACPLDHLLSPDVVVCFAWEGFNHPYRKNKRVLEWKNPNATCETQISILDKWPSKQTNNCFRKSTRPLPKKYNCVLYYCVHQLHIFFPIFFQKQTIQLLHFAILYSLAMMKMDDMIDIWM